MYFKDVVGQTNIKNHLAQSAGMGRIPHAQLFIAKEGTGALPMAIAYAQLIICQNHLAESGVSPCESKFKQLAHPDLHFSFPINNTDKIKSTTLTCNLFMEDWRAFVKQQPYGNLFDWLTFLGIENKQAQIGVNEAQDIAKKLSLKAFEGGYKVMIIWMAEEMHSFAANKLLKLLEEPPDKTVFILIVEDEEQLLPTIKSRCQPVRFQSLSDEEVASALVDKGISLSDALKVAKLSHGNLNKAFDIVNSTTEEQFFEPWFVQWVRTAFKAKGNKASIHALINWAEEVSKTNRETQKRFVFYCSEVFRKAMLYNFKAKSLADTGFSHDGFKLENFAPFVHENNIAEIFNALEAAHYHIERNGNAKIIFTDLSIKLTRLLHQKPN